MNEIERLKSIDVNGAIKNALVEQEKSKSLDEIERAMMDKLLPCPFCGSEATISDGGYSGEKFLVRCRDLSCPAASGFIRKTHDEAVAAWNRRAQPENKPLTLDELGQLREARIPVWMGRAKEWIFVASVADAPYAQVWYFNAKGFAETVLYHHEKFYRSKPKEVEHEAD